MFYVVTGGSGSGKSAYAENLVLSLGEGRRIYIATMMSFDEESTKRIARHRKMREGKQFETVECYTGLDSIRLKKDDIVLLECMSNLAANEMYAEGGTGEKTEEAVMAGIRRLLQDVRHIVVVTNEIFSDGMVYDESTVEYMGHLGNINQQMARLADSVTEVVYGIPVCMKGGKKNEASA